MKHLDFVNKLSDTGVSIRSTNAEHKEKRIYVQNPFDDDKVVIIKNFTVNYNGLLTPDFDSEMALKDIIKKAIDYDQWKHSWHNEIKPENYAKFQNMIQMKIIDRANQIDELVAIYFQLNYELSKMEADELSNETLK